VTPPPGWIVRNRDAPRTPVVLLHGFLGAPEDFSPVIAAIPTAHPVIAPPLPGHGPTPPPVAFPGNAFFGAVDHLAAHLALVGVARPALFVGYSMGGRLALGLALKHADLTSGLALIGASPGIEDGDARRDRLDADAAVAARLRDEDLGTFLDRWYALPLFADLADHPGFAAMRARRLRGDRHELSTALLALGPGTMPPLWSSLGELRVPVSVIAGEKDSTYCAINDRVGSSVPGASRHVVPGVGHAVHIEAPDAVSTVVGEMLHAIEERKT